MAENLIRIRDPRFVLLTVALGFSAIFALGLWWFMAGDSDSIEAAPELAAFVAADDEGLPAEDPSAVPVEDPSAVEAEDEMIESRGDRRDGSTETAIAGSVESADTPEAPAPAATQEPAPSEATPSKRPVLAVGGTDGDTTTDPNPEPENPAEKKPETNEPQTSDPKPAPSTTAANETTTTTPSSADKSNTDEPSETTMTPSTSATTATPVQAPEPKPAQASASGYFATLPPGSALPSGADCANRVRPVAENVPENEPFNRTRGRKVTGTYLSINTAIASNNYEARIDGNYVGSTDEIIQWAACKWGFDEDLVRAQVYTESSWFAGKLGDCGETTHERTGGNGGCSSVGLIQVRSAETGKTHHPGLYPWVMESSALNLDYALAVKRLCFEGQESWLSDVSSEYRAGDEWNCMGRWFSGSFADGGSKNYQTNLRKNLNERPWEGQYVGCPNWRDSFYCSGIDRPRIN